MSSLFQTQNWTLHVANQSDLITDLNYINDNDFNWDLVGDPFFLFGSFSGISNDPFAGINYTLVLAPGADIKLTSALPNLTLQNGSTLTIQGNGATIDGQNTYPSIQLNLNGSSPVTVSNLSFTNFAPTQTITVSNQAQLANAITLVDGISNGLGENFVIKFSPGAS